MFEEKNNNNMYSYFNFQQTKVGLASKQFINIFGFRVVCISSILICKNDRVKGERDQVSESVITMVLHIILFLIDFTAVSDLHTYGV